MGRVGFVGSAAVIVFLLASFLKDLEVYGVNLYLFGVVILGLLACAVSLFGNRPTELVHSLFTIQGLALAGFGLFVVLQRFVVSPSPQWDSVLLVIAIVFTYHIFSTGLQIGRPALRNLLWSAAVLGVGSSVLLLLQVHVSMAFDVTRYFAQLGLVEVPLESRFGYEALLARRGRGLATSIGRFYPPIVIGAFFLLKQTVVRSTRIRYLAGAGLAVISAAFVTSSSETLYVGLAGAGVIWVFLWFTRQGEIHRPGFDRIRLYIGGSVVGCIAAVGLGALVPYAVDFRSTVPASSFDVRLYLWSTTLTAFFQRPLLGHGFGNLEGLTGTLTPAIGSFGWAPDPRLPHSILFRLLGETGLIGTALFLIFVASSLYLGYKNIGYSDASDFDDIFFFTLVALVVMSFFGNIMILLDLYLVIAMIAYRTWIIRSPHRASHPDNEAPARLDT